MYFSKYSVLSQVACIILSVSVQVSAQLLSRLERLKQVYPNHIVAVNQEYIIWKDGTVMLIHDGHAHKSMSEKLNNPSLADQVEQCLYRPGLPYDTEAYRPIDDPGRIRYEPFFRKMYGNSPAEVLGNLVEIDWMPRIFGVGTYRLKVTTVNAIHEKLYSISQELEDLALDNVAIIPFLSNPGGTYRWRLIANTTRLSNHSFGMTIDINASLSRYWQWDLQKMGIAITEEAQLEYCNTIPWNIVLIFEKYGFIWGGKWYHYDTMHFEYRPELFNSEF